MPQTTMNTVPLTGDAREMAVDLGVQSQHGPRWYVRGCRDGVPVVVTISPTSRVCAQLIPQLVAPNLPAVVTAVGCIVADFLQQLPGAARRVHVAVGDPVEEAQDTAGQPCLRVWLGLAAEV